LPLVKRKSFSIVKLKDVSHQLYRRFFFLYGTGGG